MNIIPKSEPKAGRASFLMTSKTSRWLIRTTSILICALIGMEAWAEPVNLLFFPMTNAPGSTSVASSTALGGVSASLNTLTGAGAALDFAGAPGSGVNGLATGVRALCYTNGAFGTQPGQPFEPANATGGGGAANASCYALDNNDAALGLGSITNFIVTMWVNQFGKMGTGNPVGPRLFVLNAGTLPANDDTGLANSIGVKYQANNQLLFGVNTANALGAAQAADFPTNKWQFFAWVYDGTNLYEYYGSDSAAVQLISTAASAGQTVNLGSSASLIVGNRGNGKTRGFNGWIEDFRFYNGVSSNNLNFVENIRQKIAPKIPTVTGIYPDGTALLQATNTLTFTAISSSGFNLTNINLKVNGVDVSAGCTFVTNGTGSTNLTVSYAGLPQQSLNTAVMTAKDAIGLSGSSSVTFDTFSPTNFIVKAEEFDFSGGQFIDNPVYTNVMEPDSYFGMDSSEGIDTHKGQSTGDNQATDYRYDDGTGLRPQTPLAAGELQSATRFGGNIIPNHMIGNWSSAEWQNYTKTFPAGNYNVYARLSTSSGATISLDEVTSGQGTSSQTLSRLGQFIYSGTSLAAFQWVPLRQFGSLAVVNLNGQNTLRLTTGGGANADFLMLVPANTNLPAITGVYPDGQFLFEATNKLVFAATSPSTTITTNNILLLLNGTNVSSGLAFSGGPSMWNVSYNGLLVNQTYAVAISVTDSNGANASANLTIDTWNPVLQIEAEGFDFDPALSPLANPAGARYIDNAVPTPPGVPATNSYQGQIGDIFIDEQGNNLQNGQNPIQNSVAGATMSNYRTNDPCATAPVTDAKRRQFPAGALDYNIGFLGPGHWEQYTRTWPAGTYNVYARVASGANLGTLFSSWSQVIAGWGTTNQVTQHIGSFAIPSSGGYSSYFYTPLLDRFGNYSQLTLSGTNTFRDTHLVFNQTETANPAVFGLNINFYMAVAARTDQARIDAVYPDGTSLMQQTNVFSFVASNPTYGISTNNIHVTLNGVVNSNLVFTGSSSSWNVSTSLQYNQNYTAIISVTDNNGQVHSTTVNFDTFNANNFTWDAEDFDYDPANSPQPAGNGLRYIDNPIPTSAPATNSYYGQAGGLDIDYSSQFVNLNVLPIPTVYRSSAMNFNNVVPIEVTGDTQRQRTQKAQLTQVNPYIQDYDILNLTNTAWIDYTRAYPAGNFNVYARMAAGATNKVNLQLALVTSGAGTSTQTTNVLGYFQATGNNYASWQYAPLVNTNNGQPVVVSLGGVETLQIIGDGFEHVNFFMLAAVAPNPVTITPSVSGSNLILSFPTQSGYMYTMYYKNNLTDAGWTQLVGGGNPVTGNGSVQSVSDTLGQGHRFYRLTIQ